MQNLINSSRVNTVSCIASSIADSYRQLSEGVYRLPRYFRLLLLSCGLLLVTSINTIAQAAISDFNGDGKSDILWHNTASAGVNSNLIWLSADSTTPQVLPGTADINWQVGSVGDFNGDGKADILWHRITNGDNIVWFSGSPTGGQVLASVPDVLWKIAGVGDFNGDGKTDILWRNNATGANSIWLSGNNTTQQAVTSADLSWMVAGVGDFNGDGKTDIMWRNISTGSNTVWLSGDSTTPLLLVAVPLNWTVAGIANFNADATADILWKIGGASTIWLSGNSLTRQAVTLQPDLAWQIAGVGDYNGDGKADIFWRNATTGNNTIWLTGNSVTPQTVTGLPASTNWYAGTSAPAAISTRTSAFDYDAVTGLLTKEVVEPNHPELCFATEYLYDAFGNKKSITTRNCSGKAKNMVTGSPAETTPPAVGSAPYIVARTTATTYDAQGVFPVTTTNALLHSETRVFDSKFGNATQITGPNNLISQVVYDSFGRKFTEVGPEGTFVGATATDIANATTTTNRNLCTATPVDMDCPTNASYWVSKAKPGSPTTTTYFDKLGRQLRSKTIALDGTTAIFKDTQYDAKGRVLQTSRPYFKGATSIAWTSYLYDDLNRILKETVPASGQGQEATIAAVTDYLYNGLITTITTHNAVDQVTTRVKNSQGQLVSVTDANNKSITYQYDPFGNLIKTTDPFNNISTLTYDQRGRKIAMNDPDMGAWSYSYNVLGGLFKQTDAKLQVTTNSYDQLGRMTERAEPDLITRWTYDTAAYGKGKIATVTTDNGLQDTYTYDTKGRSFSTRRSVGTTSKTTNPWTFTVASFFDFSNTYDAYGHVDTRTLPSGFSQRNIYQNGYLTKVQNATTAQVYWTMNTIAADGQIATALYGNGVAESRGFDNLGRTTSTTDTIGTTIVTGMNYVYDRLGNLKQRTDAPNSLVENYTYDILNRLRTVVSSNPLQVAKSIDFDDLGNITNKSDTGVYTYAAYQTYGTNRPHAVCNIAGSWNTSYSYDLNGNVLTGGDRTYVYTSYNLPSQITRTTTGKTVNLLYGPDHERAKETEADGTISYTFNPRLDSGLHADYRIKPNGDKEYVNYIYAGNRPIGIYTTRTLASGAAGLSDLRYFHLDGQGSIVAITDETGIVKERLSYDAWGKRRNSDGTDDTTNVLISAITDHGYTGHEHLDDIGLIHMNGRVYDPRTGRFLQADPTIQFPDNLQSYNRYSYVLNNPFFAIDPSGYYVDITNTPTVTYTDGDGNSGSGTGNTTHIGCDFCSPTSPTNASPNIPIITTSLINLNNFVNNTSSQFMAGYTTLNKNIKVPTDAQKIGQGVKEVVTAVNYLNQVFNEVAGANAARDGFSHAVKGDVGDAALNLSKAALLFVTVEGSMSLKVTETVVKGAEGVAKYGVGAFNNLKASSVVGDGLDIHHAVQASPASQVIQGYDRLTAPSIAIPQGEHRLIPTITGEFSGTARDLLAKDILDLRNYTNAPNSSLIELIQMNKQIYPNAFSK